MSDLLRSLGVENSVIRGAGGGWKLALRTGAKVGAAELLALASTMIEGAKTIRHLSKGEIGDAAFSAGIAVGGAISMLPVFIQTGSIAGPIGIAIMTAAFVGQMLWQNAKHIHEGEDDVRKGLVLLGYKPGHADILSRRGKYGSGEASGKGQIHALLNWARSQGMNADDLRAWINSLTREQVARLSEAVFHGIGVGNGNLLYGPEDARKLPRYIIPPDTLVGSASFRRRMAKDFEADLIRADVPLPYSGGAVI